MYACMHVCMSVHTCMETIEHWHVRYEILGLNSHRYAYSVPTPQGPLKSPFGSALQTRLVGANFYLAQRYLRKVWHYSSSFRP